MTPTEALQKHQQVCDELHELVLAENRYLQQNQRPPDAAMLDRKRALLGRLDEALQALRAVPKGESHTGAWRQALDKAQARVLQILQLERENEQLILRFSLPSNRLTTPAASMPVGMLQKIYQRHH